ncbi:MAG: VIT1/CCC1 transporter family protein [Bryobacterales bacterium]|nr:VIT1/CCC1 transporter family protein [Bryobacterales bacterium]
MRRPLNRPSLHREPHGAYETAQHYVGDLIYGTNDGILTSFAIVAGVSGGALSATAVLIVGTANLFADGMSMGVGNYLSIRARESARERQNLPEEEANPARHGLATFLAFAVAGAIPLFPYVVPGLEFRFLLSSVLALIAQFAVGALRSLVTASRWWVSGLEMLVLGIAVAVVAYATGAGIAALVHGGA